jgi:hypothetical protein
MSALALRLAAAPILLAGLLGAALPQAPAYPQVSGFSAYLLNSRTGTLSGDMIGHDDELGNVPAGPLSSVSTLVVVRVAFGPEAALPANGRVRLVATAAARPGAARRVLLDRVARLGPVADDGTTHIGFWLDDTGCATITLRATLTAGPATASKQEVLPFTCNE